MQSRHNMAGISTIGLKTQNNQSINQTYPNIIYLIARETI